MSADVMQTFIFEETDIRGAVICLSDSFQNLLDGKYYDDASSRLLGEFCAATALLTSNLKFDGLLSLQARATGDVSLVTAECSSERVFRGIVKGGLTAEPQSFGSIFNGGALALTIEPEKGNRYQGIVPLEKDSLGDCLADYFQQSEQLPTWFTFSSSQNRVFALMLQALPAQICQDAEQRQEDWERIVHLASTLSDEEMQQLNIDEILYRLFHEEQVRVFEPQKMRYACSCSTERMERALLGLGEAELMSILEETGSIDTQCEFCLRKYAFSQADIHSLLQGNHGQSH